MRIPVCESVCLVIDIQEKLFPHMQDRDQLVLNCQKLIRGLSVLDVPFIVTEQYPKGVGSTIEPIKSIIPGADPLEKISFSCCGDEKFDSSLKNFHRKYIIIAGIEAHVCVLQTVLDLAEQGYQPVVIEDCISSRKLNDKIVAVQRMRQEGAIISTVESILFELCQQAGTETFKQISKMVK